MAGGPPAKRYYQIKITVGGTRRCLLSGWQALDYGFLWNEQQLQSYRQIVREFGDMIALQANLNYAPLL